MSIENANINKEERTELDAINSILPSGLPEIRSAFLKHNVPTVDRYGEGFLAQAYFAARNSSTGKYSSIAKALGLDKLTFQYYMEKYPDFVLAINLGKADGMKERVENIESALLSRALGMELEEQIEEMAGEADEDGNIKKPYKKVRKVKKMVPPDTQAALALLQKLDPNWNPKQTIDVNLNQSMNVTEDVSINVDYRSLSPDALRELLNSVNTGTKNIIATKTMDGKAVKTLSDAGKRDAERCVEKTRKARQQARAEKLNSNVKTTKKRVMSAETREKLSNAAKERYKKKREQEVK